MVADLHGAAAPPFADNASFDRALVLGGSGLLGSALLAQLADAGVSVLAPAHGEVDICDSEAVRRSAVASGARIVINAAAQANVNAAEREPEQAFLINAIAAQNVALAAAETDAVLVHISTDYVFDGLARRPYRECDPTGLPPSQYGRSKLFGEQLVRAACRKHFVVRVAALFGPGRHTFVDWVLEEARPAKPLRIVVDRFVSPSWTVDIADQLLRLVRTPYYGTYHLTGLGVASWYEFAVAALKHAGADPEGVVPIVDQELNDAAPRPPFSALDNFLLRLRGLDQMLPWRDGLGRYVLGR